MTRESKLVGSRRSNARNRWSEWARALSERHRRVAERYGLPDLALIRRLPLMQLLRQRWLVSFRWFQPQINLAIQPILRQAIRLERLQATPVPDRAERLVSAPLGGQRLAAWPLASQTVFLQLVSTLEKWSREPATENRPADVSPGVEVAGDPSGVVIERAAAAVQTPLHLVFKRISEAGDLIRLRYQGTVIESETHTLVNRIARQSRRVEERTATYATLVKRQPAAAAPVGGEQVSGGFQTSPIVHSAPWEPSAAPMAAVNIEQITDQVMRQLDRRVIAKRERMGRV